MDWVHTCCHYCCERQKVNQKTPKKQNHLKPQTANKRNQNRPNQPKPTIKCIPEFEWSAVHYKWFGQCYLGVRGNHMVIKFTFWFHSFLVTQHSFEQVLWRSTQSQSSKIRGFILLGMKEWHCNSFLTGMSHRVVCMFDFSIRKTGITTDTFLSKHFEKERHHDTILLNDKVVQY